MPSLWIKVISWNIEGRDPPEDLKPFLGLEDEPADLLAIGIQEMKSDLASILHDAIFDDPWTKAINNALSSKNFVKLVTKRHYGLHLSLYINRSKLIQTTSVTSELMRIGGFRGKEGGLLVEMRTRHYGTLKFCNLRLNTDNYVQGVKDFRLLQQSLKIADSDLNEETSTFCFGDFGSCLSHPELTDEVVKSLIESRNYEQLLLGDQLQMARMNQVAFHDFREGKLKFAPSFNAGPGTRPAWRDRVLFRIDNGSGRLYPWDYEPISVYDISKHKPVVAIFNMNYNFPCSITIPRDWEVGSDGMFKFEVSSTFSISPGDWLGLFPDGFRTLKEYSASILASSVRRITIDRSSEVFYQAYFEKKDLKGLQCGEYTLVYVHNKNNIIGQSRKFQLLSEGETVSNNWFGFYEARMIKTKEDDGVDISVKVPSSLNGIYIQMLQSQDCVEKLDTALRRCFSDFHPIMKVEYFASKSYFDGNDTACIACLPDAFDEVLNHYKHNQKVFVNISGAYNDRSICSLREIFNAFTSFRTNIEQKSLYQVIFSYEEEKCFITFQIPKMLREFQKCNEELNLTLNEMSDLNRRPRYNTKSLSNFKRSFQTRGLMIEDGWLEVFSPFGLPTNPPLIVAFYSSKDLYSDGSFNWSLSFLVMLATVLGGVLVTIDCVCVRPSGRNINLLAGLAFAQEFRSLIEVYVPRKCKIYFVGVGEGAFLATEVLSAANALNSGPAIDLVIIDPTCYFRPPLSNPGEEARVLMVLLERNQPDPNATSNPLSLNFATDLAAVSNVICDVFTSEKEDWINSRLRFYGNAVGLIGAYIDSNFLRPAGQ